MTFNTGFSRGAVRISLCLLLGSPGIAFSQTLPNLPVIPDISCGTSSGTTTLVPAGGSLQAAITAASPGDIIKLKAGATYVGTFTLPVKTGNSCITIRTDAEDTALPLPGERISPAYANVLPKIVAPGLNEVAVRAAYGAHHYKFIGVEFTKVNDAATTSVLLQLGDSRMTSPDQVPHHLEFDRVYVHGLPASSLKHCVQLHSAATIIANSYISGCKFVGADAQAIVGWNGPGPYRITNNYLEGSGENLMFGGADARIPNLVPSDIEITNNYFFKPLTWKIDDPSYAGTAWLIKNLLELKSARRVLLNGNTFEHSWPHGQNGFAILFTVRNQSGTAPWSDVSDITFTNNIVRHAANGVSLIGTDYSFPSQVENRILIKNNLFDDISSAWGAGYGRFLLVTNGPIDLTVDNNTVINSHKIIDADGSPPTTNFVFRNNISFHNTYGVLGSGSTIGKGTLNMYFPGYQFLHNIIIANPYPTWYPPTTYNAASISAVGFTDVATGDYSLTTASPYHNAGTDGADIGVDWIKLQAAIKTAAATRSAGTTAPPSTPLNLEIK